LRAGSRVVEVGSGTGKLTEQLVARGLVVDAVEPGPRMIASARRRVGDDANVTFHEGRFEEADLPAEAFTGLFSATAFHWIDPQVGWAKAAALLEPGGLLALLTHSAVHDDDTDAIYGGLLEIIRRHAPHVAERWRPPLELAAILDGAADRSDNASEVWDWLMGGRHE